ncbi:MAG: hypothetical protein ACK5JM_06920 [Rhodoblastus sp.]
MTLEQRKFLEKKAAEAGAGESKIAWRPFDDGNVVNDAMPAGSPDVVLRSINFLAQDI